MWYLTPKLAVFVLFSDSLSIGDKEDAASFIFAEEKTPFPGGHHNGDQPGPFNEWQELDPIPPPEFQRRLAA